MKLYIKQKAFAWAVKFTVKDEHGEDRYFVQGEVFSWGRKLHITDMNGREVALIQQKVFSFLPKYHVIVNGEQVAEIVKELTFLRPKYRIEGLGWDIDGDFWSHNYMISRNGNPIVTIQKEWMTWGDSYELDIADSRDEIVALAMVLTIDCVMASQAASV